MNSIAGYVYQGKGSLLASMALFRTADFRYPYLEQRTHISRTAPTNRPGRRRRLFNARGIIEMLPGLLCPLTGWQHWCGFQARRVHNQTEPNHYGPARSGMAG